MDMRYLLGLALLSMGAFASAQVQTPRKIKSSEADLAIKVKLDGKIIQTPGTAPIMAGSRVLVPIRGLFEEMGAHLSWDPARNEVSITSERHQILLTIGKMTAMIDGQPVGLDQPAMIVDNRTLVPLRFIGEALGAKVDWMTADRTVEIVTQ